MSKEDLIKSLNDLCNKLDNKEFDHCNLIINEMSIFFCPRIKMNLEKEGLSIYSGTSTDTTFCIKLKNINFLRVFATTATKEIKEVINYWEGDL